MAVPIYSLSYLGGRVREITGFQKYEASPGKTPAQQKKKKILLNVEMYVCINLKASAFLVAGLTLHAFAEDTMFGTGWSTMSSTSFPVG